MKASYKRIIALLCLVALIILIRVSGLHELLTFEMLRQYRDQLLAITANNYIFTVGFFIL